MIIQGVTLTGVTVVDAQAVTNSLVYLIDIGNTASYSGSGSTLNNISGSGLAAGGLSGSPTYTSAGTASYITFNGTSQYAYTGNLASSIYSPSNEAETIELWLNIPSDNGCAITEQDTQNLSPGWYDSQFELVSGTPKNRYWDYNSPWLTAGTFNRSGWNQWVLTYDGSSVITSYLNGATGQSASGFGRAMPGTYYLQLFGPCATNMGDGGYLAGQFGMLRIYNRALTSNEVAQNFNALRGRYGL